MRILKILIAVISMTAMILFQLYKEIGIWLPMYGMIVFFALTLINAFYIPYLNNIYKKRIRRMLRNAYKVKAGGV